MPRTHQDELAIASLKSLGAVLLLTSIHHVYGAIRYGTSWRYHAVYVSVAALAALIATLPSGASPKPWRLVVYGIVGFTVPVGLIGLFEGGYNHVLKNLLYFLHAPQPWMTHLFPPPLYELPDDVFFEASGILQFPLALVAGWRLAALWRHRRTGIMRAANP